MTSPSPGRPARLVSARWVLPIIDAPIREGAVMLNADGVVLAVGSREDLRTRFTDVAEERAQGVLLPGLVNAHCHLELSALRGQVPGGGGLIAWAGALMRARAALTPADAQRAAHEAATAAVRMGTVAVGDVGNSLAAVRAIEDAGLRGMVFHELVGSREAQPGGALADAARELDALTTDGLWPAGLGYALAPHAPYSVGPELLRQIFSSAARAGQPTSIHVAEDPDELALLRDGGGRWPAVLDAMGVAPGSRVPRLAPVAYLESVGAFTTSSPPLLVHMVHADAADRRRARDAGAPVVLCPRSNLHIGGQLPDVPALMADGVALALGTDSLASTDTLSLWAEMATLTAWFPAVPPARWLDAATRGGAEALQLPAYGGLGPGKRPGLLDVLVDDIAAPLESLVRDPEPGLRWVARA